MSNQDEEARIAAAVQKQLEQIVAKQQKEFAKMMVKSMKDALKGVDKANAALSKERGAVLKEMDGVRALRAKAEKEADKMVEEYFAGKQIQFKEAAKTEMLRDLVRMHIQVGKTNRDIAVWLDVPKDFVDNIRQVMLRAEAYRGDKPKRLRLDGNPKLRYSEEGRGGTIYYESPDANFDMWWEFAGGNALVIVDIPTTEKWEQVTKLPLKQRQQVLTFIGEQIVLDKISGTGSFIIGESVLTFYAETRS